MGWFYLVLICLEVFLHKCLLTLFFGKIYSCNRISGFASFSHVCTYDSCFFFIFSTSLSFYIARSFAFRAHLSSSIFSILCIMHCNFNSVVDFPSSSIVSVNVLSPVSLVPHIFCCLVTPYLSSAILVLDLVPVPLVPLIC